MTKRIPYSGLVALVLCAAMSAVAQEPLQAVLDRGYVAHWLVCGPFEPDVEEGIVAAAKAGKETLGNLDFMAPIGRVARARPKHLMEVARGEGKDPAVWQKAGAESPSLDLAPFFPGKEDGIAFAAAYLDASAPEDVLLELQTPLGARMWLNGFPVIPIRSAPVTSAGADRLILSLRTGSNLILLEIPGATYEGLADAAGMTVANFRSLGLRNRPLLEGRSGFEIAMKLYPVRPFDDLLYVPRLENTGGFSGVGADVRQEVAMTFYNPTDRPIGPFSLSVKAPGVLEPVNVVVPIVDPKTIQRAQLAIPMLDATPGQPVRLDVEMRRDDRVARLNATITALPPVEAGSVYVLTGVELAAALDSKDWADRWVERVRNEVRLREREPDYGFDLGPAIRWRAAYDLLPREREALRQAIALNHVSAWPAFAAIDERFAAGESLLRNIALGHAASSALLHDWNPGAIAWDQAALAAQSPQLLTLAGADGLVSNLPYAGQSALSYLRAPDGSRLLHRRKASPAPTLSAGDIRRRATQQRKELLDAGFPSDILVNVSSEEPPEAYWLGETSPLRRGRPSVRVSGAGARLFFREVESAFGRSATPPAFTARSMMTFHPGDLVANPGVGEALAALQHRALTAEKVATAASIIGGTYPETWLDALWRSSLALLQTPYTGVPQSPGAAIDGMAELRSSLAVADDLTARAMSFIATQANTYAEAPIRGDADRALVVFNPSGWPRTDRCVVDVQLTQAAGIALLDANGAPIPFMAERVRVLNGRIAQARLTFVAEDVPALGYKTIYLKADTPFPGVAKVEGVQIHNGRFTVTIDPNQGGSIVSIEDAEAGENVVDGIWNDLVLLKSDASKTRGGRELWSDSVLWRASANTPATTIERAGGVERIVQSYETPHGHVRRTITVLKGARPLQCTVELDARAREAGLWAVTFDGMRGRMLRLGAAYGSVTAPLSRDVFDLRTDGVDSPSESALSPFMHWAAASPGDGVRGAADLNAPFGPAVVVYGDGPAMARMAERVVAALSSRGIPAWSRRDTPPAPAFTYTDGTPLPNLEDEFTHGAAMQILLGSPEQNVTTRVALKQFDDDTVVRMTSSLEGGNSWFFLDKTLNSAVPPPTVLMMGISLGVTEHEVTRFADEVMASGIFHIAPAQWLADIPDVPKRGVAVLRRGAGLAALDRQGVLMMPLSQPMEVEGDDRGWMSAVDGPLVIEYGILPINTSWRDDRTYRAGHEFSEPLVATLSNLHLAEKPARYGVTSVEPDEFVVTALKPAGARTSAMRTDPIAPSEGLVVRGYEATGRPFSGTVRFEKRVLSASVGSLLEEPGETIAPRDSDVPLSGGGFAIATLWVTPGRGMRSAQNGTLAPGFADMAPVYTRYWRHGSLTAPPMNRPLTVLLEGRLENGASQPRLVVANNQSDKELSGEVTISASQGWSVAPARVSYSLRPGEFIEEKLVVLRPGSATSGGLIARGSVSDQTVYDVLALDDAPFTLTVEKRGNEFRARIQNTSALPLEGAMTAVTPASTWPELGTPVDLPLTPREALLFISPYESKDVTFVSPNGVPTYGVTIRAAANGHVAYAAVAGER